MASNDKLHTTAIPPQVMAVYDTYPDAVRAALLNVRSLLLKEAEKLKVGPIEETLKWGEPAYLTSTSKAGSTIRLAWKPGTPEFANIYVNCQTDLVSEVRSHFPDAFSYTGRRCMGINLNTPFPEFPVQAALSLALTYHKGGRKKAL